MKTSLALVLAAALIVPGLAGAAPARRSAPATPYTTLAKTQLLDFRYSFPSQVGSDPQLLALVLQDRAKSRQAALDGAREDSAIRRPQGFPFHQHEFWRDWIISGQSARLLSLRSQTETFTGGAHGMHSTGAMLWDKEKKRQLQFAALFASPSAFWPLIEGAFCKALAAERLRRAQLEGGECPKTDELVFVPADTRSDWKFDTIQIVADPYVAGSYAEGRYEVPLPVTARLVAALKPEFRDSFEAQRPQ